MTLGFLNVPSGRLFPINCNCIYKNTMKLIVK
jgi:hypothetical protein